MGGNVGNLVIYNETIRDLLSTSRSCSDLSRAENGVAGKQYIIHMMPMAIIHMMPMAILMSLI